MPNCCATAGRRDGSSLWTNCANATSASRGRIQLNRARASNSTRPTTTSLRATTPCSALEPETSSQTLAVSAPSAWTRQKPPGRSFPPRSKLGDETPAPSPDGRWSDGFCFPLWPIRTGKPRVACCSCVGGGPQRLVRRYACVPHKFSAETGELPGCSGSGTGTVKR